MKYDYENEYKRIIHFWVREIFTNSKTEEQTKLESMLHVAGIKRIQIHITHYFGERFILQKTECERASKSGIILHQSFTQTPFK